MVRGARRLRERPVRPSPRRQLSRPRPCGEPRRLFGRARPRLAPRDGLLRLRSDEHTSELQFTEANLGGFVLLEKKKLTSS